MPAIRDGKPFEESVGITLFYVLLFCRQQRHSSNWRKIATNATHPLQSYVGCIAAGTNAHSLYLHMFDCNSKRNYLYYSPPARHHSEMTNERIEKHVEKHIKIQNMVFSIQRTKENLFPIWITAIYPFLRILFIRLSLSLSHSFPFGNKNVLFPFLWYVWVRTRAQISLYGLCTFIRCENCMRGGLSAASKYNKKNHMLGSHSSMLMRLGQLCRVRKVANVTLFSFTIEMWHVNFECVLYGLNQDSKFLFLCCTCVSVDNNLFEALICLSMDGWVYPFLYMLGLPFAAWGDKDTQRRRRRQPPVQFRLGETSALCRTKRITNLFFSLCILYTVCVPSYLRDIYPNKITQPSQITLRMKMQRENERTNKKRLRIKCEQHERGERQLHRLLPCHSVETHLKDFFRPCICRMAFQKQTRREKNYEI